MTDEEVYEIIADALYTQEIRDLNVLDLDALALFNIDSTWEIDEIGLDQDAPHGINTEEEMRGNA